MKKYKGLSYYSNTWIFGYYHNVGDAHYINQDGTDYEIIKESLCLFTGEYDKKGVEIYQNDTYKYGAIGFNCTGIVVLENNIFLCVKTFGTCSKIEFNKKDSWGCSIIEITGNMHK